MKYQEKPGPAEIKATFIVSLYQKPISGTSSLEIAEYAQPDSDIRFVDEALIIIIVGLIYLKKQK